MKTKFNLYAASVLALSLLASVLRPWTLITLYNPAVGYLEPSKLSTVLTVIVIIGLLCCVSGGFLFRTATITDQPKSWSILYALAAAACFFSGIFYFTTERNSINADSYIGILSIAVAAFFLLLCSPDTTKSASMFAKVRPWLYVVAIILMLLLLITSYFDTTVTINGPFASPFIFTTLACCLFLLMEIRREIGRGLPRLHLSITAITVFLSFSTGIGQLAFSLFGDTGSGITIAEPARPALLLAIGFCAVARLFCFSVKQSACKAAESEK